MTRDGRDIAAIGACRANLGERVDAKGGRHIFAYGLAIDQPFPESVAILDGPVDLANVKKLFEAGIDPYSVWTKRCREKGVSPWISMRMNDAHYLTASNYFRNTTFCRNRRDLRYVPKSNKCETDFAVDFAQKEVQDYDFAQFREIAGKWDADGIELDWMRNPHCLKPCRERADAHYRRISRMKA